MILSSRPAMLYAFLSERFRGTHPLSTGRQSSPLGEVPIPNIVDSTVPFYSRPQRSSLSGSARSLLEWPQAEERLRSVEMLSEYGGVGFHDGAAVGGLEGLSRTEGTRRAYREEVGMDVELSLSRVGRSKQLGSLKKINRNRSNGSRKSTTQREKTTTDRRCSFSGLSFPTFKNSAQLASWLLRKSVDFVVRNSPSTF